MLSAGSLRISQGVYLLSVSASICVLVSVNALSPFVVASLAPARDVSTIVGTLVFADQLLAVALVLVWGWLADRTSAKLLIVAGHAIVALALAIFPTCRRAYPELLLTRLLFSVRRAGSRKSDRPDRRIGVDHIHSSRARRAHTDGHTAAKR